MPRLQAQDNFSFAIKPQAFDIKLENLKIELEREFFFEALEKYVSYFKPNKFTIFKRDFPRRERFARINASNFKNLENYFTEAALSEIKEKFGSIKDFLQPFYTEAWNLARLKIKHHEIMTGVKGVFKPVEDYTEVEIWHSGSTPGCCKDGKHRYSLKDLPELPLPQCKRNGVYCQCMHNVILDNEITRSIKRSNSQCNKNPINP